ncbi:hypothetical protein BC936DRAFT_141584 [Jimgerdemannia flammicorona]|uniref:Uncharacterized protein n=1 Tax=Jimgerdemannia flammicorona TaxID=994334 RepID=A0A433DNG1_9FUNG|nr:hypothetical protein BC936DRAFT_141584 [Jimgerdemannia flammicorona]
MDHKRIYEYPPPPQTAQQHPVSYPQPSGQPATVPSYPPPQDYYSSPPVSQYPPPPTYDISPTQDHVAVNMSPDLAFALGLDQEGVESEEVGRQREMEQRRIRHVSYYDSRVVLQAFTVTACTFVALTIFTVQSRIKFDGLGPFLFGATWVLIFVGIVQLFLPFYFWTHILITIASGMIFTLYIIYDTYQIWNRLSPEGSSIFFDFASKVLTFCADKCDMFE